MRPLSLGDLIDDIITGHPSLTEKHRLEIVVPDNLPKVLGDEDRVGQVLLNLLSNANRHSQPGTTITIGARLTSEEGRRAVEVCVADQGIGISAQDRSRLFSKFAMLPKPEWIAKGTGLGLYISKGIIEAHGGRLWVDSEPDQGSTFCFSLTPAADGP